jgi:uncharacterized protein
MSDGTIKNIPYISLTGSLRVCLQFKAFLEKTLDRPMPMPYLIPNKNSYSFTITMEYGAPVMIHTGDTFSNTGKIRFSHPLNIDDIAVDNPELRIIMCHLGNPWIVECQEVLYKNKNVYADISGLFIGDFTSSAETYYISKIRELLKYVGVYGTDWPICDMESYIKFVRKFDLDRQSFDLLMFSNSKKIFVL